MEPHPATTRPAVARHRTGPMMTTLLPSLAPTVDLDAAELAAAQMLAALGIDVSGEHARRTPRRLVRALDELTSGRLTDPAVWLDTTFPPESDDPGMISVPGIPFVSICEHHLLPFE